MPMLDISNLRTRRYLRHGLRPPTGSILSRHNIKCSSNIIISTSSTSSCSHPQGRLLTIPLSSLTASRCLFSPKVKGEPESRWVLTKHRLNSSFSRGCHNRAFRANKSNIMECPQLQCKARFTPFSRALRQPINRTSHKGRQGTNKGYTDSKVRPTSLSCRQSNRRRILHCHKIKTHSKPHFSNLGKSGRSSSSPFNTQFNTLLYSSINNTRMDLSSTSNNNT